MPAQPLLGQSGRPAQGGPKPAFHQETQAPQSELKKNTHTGPRMSINSSQGTPVGPETGRRAEKREKRRTVRDGGKGCMANKRPESEE